MDQYQSRDIFEVEYLKNGASKEQSYCSTLIGRIASEDVIIELLKAKCLPALY